MMLLLQWFFGCFFAALIIGLLIGKTVGYRNRVRHLEEDGTRLQLDLAAAERLLEEFASIARSTTILMRTAESDADRLAPIVAQYVKDVDDTAKLMGDENPPALTAEREALRLHAEALKLRTNEKTDCQPIPAPLVPEEAGRPSTGPTTRRDSPVD